MVQKLGWCTKSLWNQGLEAKRASEGKWVQAREARKTKLQSQGTSPLGSGDRSRFSAIFVSILSFQ